MSAAGRTGRPLHVSSGESESALAHTAAPYPLGLPENRWTEMPRGAPGLSAEPHPALLRGACRPARRHVGRRPASGVGL